MPLWRLLDCGKFLSGPGDEDCELGKYGTTGRAKYAKNLCCTPIAWNAQRMHGMQDPRMKDAWSVCMLQ